jgi:hypothetical protein
MARHLPARFRAAAASIGACPHLSIICELLTAPRAQIAYLGANGTGARVLSRSTQHEVGAGLAYLRAIHQQGHMAGFYMQCAHLTAHLQAVAYSLVAFLTQPYALLQLFTHLAAFSVQHRNTPFSSST